MCSNANSQSTLLALIETYASSSSVYSSYSDYLKPFFDHAGKLFTDSKLARSLAEKYISFLNLSVKLLPKQLSNLHQEDRDTVKELIRTYGLCLDCIESISHVLTIDSLALQKNMVNVVSQVEALGFYEEAEAEGFRVLNKLRTQRTGKINKLPSRLEEVVDANVALLLVRLVLVIVKCVSRMKRDSDELCFGVIELIKDSQHWFGLLDSNLHDNLHSTLVRYLGKCALAMLPLKSITSSTMQELCVISLKECSKSRSENQLFKVARNMIYSLLFISKEKPKEVKHILRCILNFLSQRSNNDAECWETEVLDEVSSVVMTCACTRDDMRASLANFLHNFSDDAFFQNYSIFSVSLKMYSAAIKVNDALFIKNCDNQSNDYLEESFFATLIASSSIFFSITTLFGSFRSHFVYDLTEPRKVSSVTLKPPLSSPEVCGKFYRYYIEALYLVCRDIVMFWNTELIIKVSDASVINVLRSMQEVCHEFCLFYLLNNCYIYKLEELGADFKNTHAKAIATTLLLSLVTETRLQESVNLTEDTVTNGILEPWNQKFVSDSIFNHGVVLYRNKMDEASETFLLFSNVSWNFFLSLCKVSKSNLTDSVAYTSEDTVLGYYNDLCLKTSLAIERLWNFSIFKAKEVLEKSVESWVLAVKGRHSLPFPIDVVETWAKVIIRINQKGDCCDQIKFPIFSSSSSISKKDLRIILEQELYICEKMESINSQFFKSMKVKVAEFLNIVIFHDDNDTHASTIILRKAWTQCDGTHDGLKRCIKNLSEAIHFMESQKSDSDDSVVHRVTAYFLRAISHHEDQPNSKLVIEDVETALGELNKDLHSHHNSTLSEEIAFSHCLLPLLFNIIDLLALQATSKLYIDFLKLVFVVLKENGVPMAKCVSLLWGTRRLGHSLCSSLIDDSILKNLSEIYPDLDTSTEFWVNCLDESPVSSAGFKETFCFPDDLKIHCGDLKGHAKIRLNDCTKDFKNFNLANTCYASCSELVSRGKLFQAIEFAKEALRLRELLFEEKFEYFYEELFNRIDTTGHNLQGKRRIVKLRLRKSTTTEFWPLSIRKFVVAQYYISPWKSLQCYLESVLQTATINEMIGNGLQAEDLLRRGKDLSILQNLPLFTMSFSLALGKIYYRKKSWDMADKELKESQEVYASSRKTLSCPKCGVMLEVAINQQLSEINFNRYNGSLQKDMDGLICFESLLRSSLEMLRDSAFNTPLSSLMEDQLASVKTSSVPNCIGRRAVPVQKDSKKLRNVPKSLLSDPDPTANNLGRMTRSRYRKEKLDINMGVEKSQSTNININKSFNEEHVNKKYYQRDDSTCICRNLGCWFCLENEVRKCGNLFSHIYWKWEITRRRLYCEILSNLGKLLDVHNNNHETHRMISERISVLYYRNAFTTPPDPLKLFFSFSVDKNCWDIFTVERAELLIDICWLSLRRLAVKSTRTSCCGISDIRLSTLVAHLIDAFVACRCLPDLLRRVSRILTVVFVLSTSSYLEPLHMYYKILSESHWASFFHQVSINVNFTCRYLLNATDKDRSTCHFNYECQVLRGEGKYHNLHRLVPDTVTKLENFVLEFFAALPQTTIICMSLLDEGYQNILNYIFKSPSWLMISCMNATCNPLVMLLPVTSISEGISEILEDSFSSSNIEDDCDKKRWHCPWGQLVVDVLVSQFRHILDGNYSNASKPPSEDTNESRKNWWNRRVQLNSHLSELVRKIEDNWFGAWKFALLAKHTLNVDSVKKLLKRSSKSKIKVQISDSLIRALIAIASHSDEDLEAFLSRPLSLNGDCVLVKPCDQYHETHQDYHQIYEAITQFLRDSAETPIRESNSSKSLILVLDNNIQMLPWENLPIFRKQEIYRMPSVTSILMVLHRNESPMINPLNSFYLINPSGDLPNTQSLFEDLFRQQQIQGKAGSAPSVEELACALKKHDVFIYMGHGSGESYISNRKVETLEECAGSVLVGCSSGSLTLAGEYGPYGTPLAYLIGGSPFIVANLWDVTDLDIDRFGKKLVQGLLSESEDCDWCERGVSTAECAHRRTVGALMSEARDACKLPFLTGAAPVCYGVPTIIRRSNS